MLACMARLCVIFNVETSDDGTLEWVHACGGTQAIPTPSASPRFWKVLMLSSEFVTHTMLQVLHDVLAQEKVVPSARDIAGNPCGAASLSAFGQVHA